MDKTIEKTIKYFKEISAVPRCSKKEEAIGRWMKEWALQNGFEAKRDKTGNVIISVPASSGSEGAPYVILQGHLDMVCEKTPDSLHDFSKDPIRVIEEEGWLKSCGTTLGADNGIAMALAMDVATDPSLVRPPLELLFTVDEETGLNGARSLDPGSITGRVLINLDSETEGEFIIGCAGGRDILLTYPADRALRMDKEKEVLLSVNVGGLSGGHSGMDIDKGRGNANKILAEIIEPLFTEGFHLLSLSGGSAHNAIPREAGCLLAVERSKKERVIKALGEACRRQEDKWRKAEKKISCRVEEASEGPENTLLMDDKARALFKLLKSLPDGVFSLHPEMKGLVETSDNVAVLSSSEDRVEILLSLRSSSPEKLDELTERIVTLGTQWGATPLTGEGYPPWEPDTDSGLLKRCVALYQELFGKAPQVKSIHAGLECGIIGSKFSDMEMISLGPDIENPHSPDEKMNIASLARLKKYLVALLESLARESAR
ncbi:MAG TPA: beta-Ala-His dipeptidase [Candidatus Mcinerneyibacteriales bacterium]|nr:beta-Ala-His dipeptidase [Candidatus Mcinerneyibacteriales bacterium]HPE20245.1 beta-Ala-His dipeptidase [Candidatus Mcinerneyibacteriales bacterium]HPJ69623.1 beta-Ala-His dipeptidase [Candidatus Mcinerneyibacteriales bacterium]HPQ88938.1 beta-Ala-His dipeptidase [Candidatus Mcinerneyibacteriales bacterium]